MTAYFDSFRRRLNEVEIDSTTDAGLNQAWAELEALDEEIVKDCMVGIRLLRGRVSEELRESVHRTMLQWSVVAGRRILDCVGGRALPTTVSAHRVDTPTDYVEALRRLEWDLHSCWHGIAQADRSIGDDPRTPIRELLADVEDEHVALVQEGKFRLRL